jgi:ABC-type phosphate transport system substrate-binding protein
VIKLKENRKGLGLTGAAALLALLVAGCGVNPDEAPESAGASGAAARYVPPKADGTPVQRAKPTPRASGTIRIAGKAQGSLTEDLIDAYDAGDGATKIVVTPSNENRAFEAFCSGQADIVDSARPISEAEYRQCIANDIQPVQFQVASDAAVLAIKNETDVGTDCLSFEEVRNIFRAGSTINSWSQVGYGHGLGNDGNEPRLKVAGPDEDSNVFGFFGQYVLGDPEPTMLSVRSDYQAFPTDAGVRRAVRDAKAEVAKGIADNRPPEDRARDRAKLAKAESNLRNLKKSLPDARGYVARNRAAVRRLEEVRGTLGLFRFSYYEAFEEQLRPMEVSASNDFAKPECIFPSQATVTNATYPLARQLLLTVNYRNMRDPDINEFLVDSLSRSQELAESVSLVPLPDETRDKEIAWLNGSSEPDIIFYKSSPALTIGTRQEADSPSGE